MHTCQHKPVHLRGAGMFSLVAAILNKLLCLTFLTFRTGTLDRDLEWIKGNNAMEVWGNLESAMQTLPFVLSTLPPESLPNPSSWSPFCCHRSSPSHTHVSSGSSQWPSDWAPGFHSFHPTDHCPHCQVCFYRHITDETSAPA